MKVITIVLEEKKEGMSFHLFNEKDQTGLTTENEQNFANGIEEGFKGMSKMLKEMEGLNKTSI